MRENPGCVDRDALARPAEVLEGMVKSVLASAGQVGQEIVDAHGSLFRQNPWKRKVDDGGGGNEDLFVYCL